MTWHTVIEVAAIAIGAPLLTVLILVGISWSVDWAIRKESEEDARDSIRWR